MSYAEAVATMCNYPDEFFANLQPLLLAAHEFGHILQYKNRMSVDGPWLMEPHADFMAGWYVGNHVKRNLDDTTLIAFSHTMFAFGDTGFNAITHHGQPEFRSAMVRAG
jgi:hypothetical protein